MAKWVLILVALAAISGGVAAVYFTGKAHGVSECEGKQHKATLEGVEDDQAKADEKAKRVADGAKQSVETDKAIGEEADRREEEIRNVDLSPEPDRGVDHENRDVPVMRCTDPLGPEYHRVLEGNRADPAAEPARTGPAVPD